MNFIKLRYTLLVKSQLAGFFAFLLWGCTPQLSPHSQHYIMQQAQTEPAAAMQLARHRLANDELTAALRWFRQAALLGDSAGLTHALQLQQRLEGRLATAVWLEQHLNSQQLAASAVSAAQRATLGVWQAEPAPTADSGYLAVAGCKLTLQPVASQQAGVQRWRHLKTAWASDPLLGQLPVCFKPLITISATALSCSEDPAQRIKCEYGVLTEQVITGNFSQLLVIAGQGLASYNNGIVQLPDTASLALLQHEFMHALGFIDEYPLAAAAAAEVCKSGTFATNLLFDNTPATRAAYQQRWQLQLDLAILTPVTTCQASKVQAYRVVATINPMQAYQTAMPALYQQLIVQALSTPEHIMPVQYYFAYLARQQQAWQQWHTLMQRAASNGYDDAINALQL